MSRKKKLSFEELIAVNRKHIIADQKLMDQIEKKIEKRMNDTLSR
ncbi:FbpB family small basic protein [Pontibacillus litoralis]|uniref:FbpB family small basic protein n=1 Tax=Pontibacillus litoralis JSM 072002 TaxID=1385512 RepID=A0A0A5G375_9BACI|nr:FbpB family small basic protein [Pontibacillus litoralis]KGX87556.1 hypothetical protein N784_15020 [Pontibacillus litoralis JSM 072002]